MVADIEELETMDASEIYSKRLNAKEVLTPMIGKGDIPVADIEELEQMDTSHEKWENVYSQSQMEQVKSLEEIDV